MCALTNETCCIYRLEKLIYDMSDYLPPLNALRAFEAAARHLSFAQAADELSVTPAALSHQVKNLEKHIGKPLFVRRTRAVELTELGRTLHPFLTDAFNTLTTGWRTAQRSIDDKKLTITAGPAFTAKWLAPRMFEFSNAHPDIELRFSASLRIMDFGRDEIDLAIRFGQGADKDFFSETLFEDWVTPMMHPSLAEKIKVPKDLGDAVLIHDDSLDFLDKPPDWACWLRRAGLNLSADHGPRFSNGDHAIDLAQEGGGVVLGRASLSDRALRDGRLVAPFELAIFTGASYRLVCPFGAEERPIVQSFRTWVQKELDNLRDLTARQRPVAQFAA